MAHEPEPQIDAASTFNGFLRTPGSGRMLAHPTDRRGCGKVKAG
jgi:hypothetical protein